MSQIGFPSSTNPTSTTTVSSTGLFGTSSTSSGTGIFGSSSSKRLFELPTTTAASGGDFYFFCFL